MTPHIVHVLIVSPKLPSIGIGRDRRLRVARHLDLGNDVDESLAVRRPRSRERRLACRTRRARLPSNGAVVVSRTCRPTIVRSRHAPTSVEPRILLDLDSPALVIGEMPVERVHFVQRDADRCTS